jgi:hypothetical protein
MKTAHHLHDFGHDFGDPHFKNPPKKMDVPPDDHGRLGNHAIFCSLSTLGLKYPAAQPKIWASLKLVPPR